MCGTVGLFTGCAAAAYCPASQLKKARGTPGSGSDEAAPARYKSPFAAWDAKASVRSQPRRELADDGKALFPADLVPVANHPLVRELPPPARARLLTQHLYRYLHFTAKLEYLVVNHVTLGIAHGSVAVPIPEQMKFDAFKIYCDEAYHSLFSVDLIRQAAAITNIEPRLDDTPFFLQRLASLKEEHEACRAGLIEILFTIVSETLITATLTEVARSNDVAPAVTQTVLDHAKDEGRHHVYFATYLKFLWASLDSQERLFAGRILPELIDVFLRPDLVPIRHELHELGLTRDGADQVVAETFSDDIQKAYMRATASKVVGYFQDIGAFDDREARLNAERRGLLGVD